jgi:hypothetical protein
MRDEPDSRKAHLRVRLNIVLPKQITHDLSRSATDGHCPNGRSFQSLDLLCDRHLCHLILREPAAVQPFVSGGDMKLQRRRENTERHQTIAPGPGNENVGCRRRDKLNIAVRQSGHRHGSARGQDMFEIDGFFFEVTFTLGDPDRREVQARRRSRQSDFSGRFRLREACCR